MRIFDEVLQRDFFYLIPTRNIHAIFLSHLTWTDHFVSCWWGAFGLGCSVDERKSPWLGRDRPVLRVVCP